MKLKKPRESIHFKQILKLILTPSDYKKLLISSEKEHSFYSNQLSNDVPNMLNSEMNPDVY